MIAMTSLIKRRHSPLLIRPMDPSFSSLAWTVCFLTLLITSSHYDNDHSSFESDHAYVSSKYKQQQRQMNTTILELKTILASPPKNLKRKLLHSVAKYTKNGVSTFNPRILELEIFKAWDVNLNPRPAASNDKKNKKSELCLRISLPGNGLMQIRSMDHK